MGCEYSWMASRVLGSVGWSVGGLCGLRGIIMRRLAERGLSENGRIHRKVTNRRALQIILNLPLIERLDNNRMYFRSTSSDDQNLVLGLKNTTFPTSSHSSLSSK